MPPIPTPVPIPAPSPNPRPTSAQMSPMAAKMAALSIRRTATVVSDEMPAIYRVENLRDHEFPVVGVIVHPRIIPGYSYRVRPLSTNKYLFNGRALQLLQIGLGYGKRITFKADSGTKNGNENYFWSDSRPEGFGFELSVLGPGDKFTVINSHHKTIGNCEVICDKEPQKEQSHLVWPDGTIEKWVVVHFKCKIEWTECGSVTDECVTGIAIASKNTRQGAATLIRVMNCKLKHYKGCKGFVTLMPGVDSHTPRITVAGPEIPVTYTIRGLLSHEFPVIGTYVDKRIVPGFHYMVRPAHAKSPLFGGKALKLLSLGRGYGKKFTFESDNRNSNGNYFWSDSYLEGYGFTPKAVFEGHRFKIFAGEDEIGVASVRKANTPQIEIETVLLPGGGIQKRLRIEVSCILKIGTVTTRASKVCGTAVMVRKTMNGTAVVKKIENPGLDTKLNSILRHIPGELSFVAFRHQQYVMEQEYPDSDDDNTSQLGDDEPPVDKMKSRQNGTVNRKPIMNGF